MQQSGENVYWGQAVKLYCGMVLVVQVVNHSKHLNFAIFSMQKTIISVKNLKKNYGSFEAVKGISFDVLEGEIFGLLGPNGAGKSTTLEIIETLRDKTSGEVIVNGINLDKDPDGIKKIIGVQLQTSGFYPGLNLLELIELFGGLYNQRANAIELLKLVNLTDKAKNKYKEM